MNKKLKFFLIFCGIIICLWVVGRLTNTLQFFTASTVINHPSLKQGSLFFASNLIQPKRFDFICYKTNTPEYGKQIWVHRLCGMENDTIEIRNGNLLVNNEYVDSKLPLTHMYKILLTDYEKLSEEEKFDEASTESISSDSVLIFLADQTIVSHGIKATRYIIPKDWDDGYTQKQYGKKWNIDHFGPIVVPKNKYFVLGDNRSNSQDSRFIGFIDKSDWVGTVIGH
jgi:signal peptidase I